MNKIKISIINDSLFFSYKKDNVDVDKLLNTNIISNDELLFSDDYIRKNSKIVSAFIREIMVENNTTNIICEDLDLTLIVLPLMKKINIIEQLTIKDEVSLSYSIYEKLVENKNVKLVNCYSIPPFIIELLDKHNIKSETRFEIFFTSDFMQNNGLISYSKIYYKMNLRLDMPFKKQDFEDFKTFCKLNKYLKNIHLPKYDKAVVQAIVSVLHEERIKNIKILIHDNINDANIANELKALNKRLKRKYKISVKVVYSSDYLKASLGSELIFSTLKVCSIIIFVIVLLVIGSISFANYHAVSKVDIINNNINAVIEEYEKKLAEDETLQSVTPNKYYSLLQLNSDTVGWINVKNTKIDYPVVQAKDNDYYLDHDFDKKFTYNGWIFMDYRNKFEGGLNKNTIIYGHNHFYTGIMFGTLRDVSKPKWLEDLSNHIITFDTLEDNYKWQIFSIYKINKTSDYLQVEFESDENFLNFANMLKNRSTRDFMVNIKADDQILTLSTCVDDNARFVVHAIRLR